MTSLQNLTVQNPVTQNNPATADTHLVTLAQLRTLLAGLFVGIWSKTTTYGQGVVCSSGNALWQSLVANNLNNSPAASPADWALILSSPSAGGLTDLHIQVVAGGTATLSATLGVDVTGQAVKFVFEPVTPVAPTAGGYSIDLTQQAQQTRTATIVDAALGGVSYALTGTDTATPGIYRGQFQFTASGVVQLFPAAGWIEFEVVVAAASTNNLYVAYAADAAGTSFSQVPSSALPYIAFRVSTTPLTPLVTDFAGRWVRFGGLNGTNGTNGTNGASVTGATGATGADGPTGAAGADGAAGATGANGADGSVGDTGPTGDTGATGAAGIPAYVYVAWASSNTGTGFSTTAAPGLNWLAVVATNTVMTTVNAANFAAAGATWVNVAGPAGAAGAAGANGSNGASVYAYVGYASDNTGTAYSPTPGSGLNYIAIKLSSTPISVPVAGTFAGLWMLYSMTTPPVVPTSTTGLAEGTNLYFTTARVLAVALAGLDGTASGAVTTADTVLSGLGKLQNRLANVESAMVSPLQALFSEGVIAVASASAGATYTLPTALLFTPSRVLLTLSIPSGGTVLGLVAVGVPTTTGFAWKLSAAAPATGYQIFYRIT